MRDIIQKLCQGDQAAFKIFFFQHKDDIYKYAFLHLRDQDIAHDIVQEVFTKFWNKRMTINPDQNVRAYLYAICRNVVFEELRKSLQSLSYINYLKSNFQEGRNTSEESLHFKELESVLQKAICLLPNQRQRIYRMSKLENLSNDEIAQRLQISKNTVRDQLVKGSKFVREYIVLNSSLITLCLFYIDFF